MGHSSAPAEITLMYILYKFTIFMAYLVREPEWNVQGVVKFKEW